MNAVICRPDQIAAVRAEAVRQFGSSNVGVESASNGKPAVVVYGVNIDGWNEEAFRAVEDARYPPCS